MINSYVKRKAIWYRNNSPTDQVEITDIISVSTSEDKEPTNNTCNMTILDDDIYYQSNVLKFKENDTIIVYAKIVTSNDDIDYTDTDIVWTGKFVDYEKTLSADANTLKLVIADYGYDVYNKYDTKSYDGLGLKTDEVVVDVINRLSLLSDGSGNFALDTSNVETLRNDASNFPVIEPAFGIKPFYELINELSSTGWTNSETEITDGEQINTRFMVFRIKGNLAYWYYPSTTVDRVFTEDDYIIEAKEKSTNQESANYLILDCGSDFNDRPIYAYIYDKGSSSSLTKQKSEAKKSLGGGNSDYDQKFHQLKKKYTLATNSDFRTEVRMVANNYAEFWFKFFGRGKTEVSLTIPREDLFYGQIVQLDLPKFSNQKYQIEGVVHTIGKEWTTQLRLKKYVE